MILSYRVLEGPENFEWGSQRRSRCSTYTPLDSQQLKFTTLFSTYPVSQYTMAKKRSRDADGQHAPVNDPTPDKMDEDDSSDEDVGTTSPSCLSSH